MSTINFKYDYPYCGYGEIGRFRCQWAESRATLNGSYTYPMLFNTAVPNVSHIKIEITITNTGVGTVLGRSWDFMVRLTSGGWRDILTFTMPEDGLYTIDCDVPDYTITQFAVVPSSNPGSSREWTSRFSVKQLTLTEPVTLGELASGTFLYGVFANYYGLEKKPAEVYVNIDGSLVPVTDMAVNIDGKLEYVPTVLSACIKTESESMKVYVYTVPIGGKYKICQKSISGDHEIRLYSSDFTPLSDGYFYSGSFEFTEGTLLYITVTHYFKVDESESHLLIYKEE